MILETVLLRSPQIATLILSDFDGPGPGDGAGAGVDVDVDGHTAWADGHPHVLPGVVATDDWWGGEPRNIDWQENESL